ncbi:RimK family alpha-L-glutamate ligase [Streptomyces sp. CRN 30]|uniref:RimK family alpha-L-glutamate ligase n=1 Tax=Streptomyces sp. CRN 30 TaxID=3075613 RepID=UPI002A7EF0DD|nr:RimK family alpha-L-glutamate ligase [Streptomyces sp. CRN 30]
MVRAAGPQGTSVPSPEAAVWLLLGRDLDQDRVTGVLGEALGREFGPDCAVVHSSRLLLGLRAGDLTLHGMDGAELAAPRVVYARLSTPQLSCDREATLLRQLRAMGAALVNPVEAVLACVNKFWHLQELALAGLPVPDTRTYTAAELGEAIAAGVPEPCVVKAVRGHRGRRVFLAPDAATLRDVHGCLAADVPYLFQDYVAHSHGRDLRVIVVDGRTAAAQVRTGACGSFKSNLSLGGTGTPCLGRYPEGEALAERAARALGLGVAGVDLLFEADGGFTVCEVNANVSWRPPLDGTVVPAVVAACRARLAAADASGRPARCPDRRPPDTATATPDVPSSRAVPDRSSSVRGAPSRSGR